MNGQSRAKSLSEKVTLWLRDASPSVNQGDSDPRLAGCRQGSSGPILPRRPLFRQALSEEDTGAARTVFVSSLRDNEVLAVDLATDTITRIAVGVLPTRLLLSPDQTRLYVANSESDT